MMHQIRNLSKTKTMVVFKLQSVNSSVLRHSFLSANENWHFNLPVVERMSHGLRPTLNHRARDLIWLSLSPF